MMKNLGMVATTTVVAIQTTMRIPRVVEKIKHTEHRQHARLEIVKMNAVQTR